MGRKHKTGNSSQPPARRDDKMGNPSWGKGHTTARKVFKKNANTRRRRRDRSESDA